eukprot:scaffold225_cov235-Pinguiococcus_pyrenoidosus.AAC.13
MAGSLKDLVLLVVPEYPQKDLSDFGQAPDTIDRRDRPSHTPSRWSRRTPARRNAREWGLPDVEEG